MGSEFWSQQVRIGNETTGIKWGSFTAHCRSPYLITPCCGPAGVDPYWQYLVVSPLWQPQPLVHAHANVTIPFEYTLCELYLRQECIWDSLLSCVLLFKATSIGSHLQCEPCGLTITPQYKKVWWGCQFDNPWSPTIGTPFYWALTVCMSMEVTNECLSE